MILNMKNDAVLTPQVPLGCMLPYTLYLVCQGEKYTKSHRTAVLLILYSILQVDVYPSEGGHRSKGQYCIVDLVKNWKVPSILCSRPNKNFGKSKLPNFHLTKFGNGRTPRGRSSSISKFWKVWENMRVLLQPSWSAQMATEKNDSSAQVSYLILWMSCAGIFDGFCICVSPLVTNEACSRIYRHLQYCGGIGIFCL